MMTQERKQTLYLKWGTVKGWEGLSAESIEALQKWADLGTAMSATAHPRSDAHTEALCGAIDVVASQGGTIWNDWDDEKMTPDSAKDYVRGYGK